MAATTERRCTLALLALALVPLACVDEYAERYNHDGDRYFTAAQWKKIQTLTPLPDPPPDSTNHWADDEGAATLGQRFYFDHGYGWHHEDASRSTRSGCDVCHDPNKWFADPRTGGYDESRDITTVLNVAYYEWHTWDGRFDSLWALPLGPTEGEFLRSSRLEVAHRIADAYADEYTAVFGNEIEQFLVIRENEPDRLPERAKPSEDDEEANAAWNSMRVEDQELVNRIFANFGKALAAYMRRLVSRNSPFDRYVAGEYGLLSDSAKRGLELYIGYGNCIACHAGPAMTDNAFYNIGVPKVDHKVRPLGRYEAIPKVLDDEFNVDGEYSDDRKTARLADLEETDADIGAFRTPSLRNVAETPRFMHAGQFATLRDVITHYNEFEGSPPIGGELAEEMVRLTLDGRDIADLEEFLRTLTGEDLDEALTKPLPSPE
jgi:cytochrome c peroxidase